MFPKNRRGKKGKPTGGNEDSENIGAGEEFDWDKYVAARRKLHRDIAEMWARAGRLAEEIGRSRAAEGAEAVRQLRKFADRFANVEISKLRENDPKKAERIFRRFLEQGAEVLCAAGAADPQGAVSCVAMQLNCPLLSVAPSDELRRRCDALLEAILALPDIFDRHVAPVEGVVQRRQEAARQAAAEAVGIRLVLLVPDASATLTRGGVELPGVSRVDVELPPGSTLADLREAALRTCRCPGLAGAAPRMFCGSRFVGGAGDTPLAEVEALQSGLPVQCLPSNSALRHAGRQAGAAAAAAAAAAPRRGGTEAPAASPSATAAQAPPEVHPRPAPDHRPSARMLAGGGLEDRHGALVKAQGSRDLGPSKPGADEARLAAERRAKEALERQAAQQSAGDDEFFDDFFAEAKAAEVDPAQGRPEVEQPTEPAGGQGLAGAAGQGGNDWFDDFFSEAEGTSGAGPQKEQAGERTAPSAAGGSRRGDRRPGQADAGAIVAAAGEEDLRVRRRRTCWDESWEHSCAGELRADGSGIFCHPCGAWISTAEPYDHRGFELHCEKVGHYGWID
ncbi:unnamed protein product [Prorocentrum cordatum]|uniref:Uncharacterized protein n=1 Tax=Prorocentrum cordatum TaxID=2364126 RepID=A0ABN9T748_9DINO|nr:unnamed protein product [Polarella glacialis]